MIGGRALTLSGLPEPSWRRWAPVRSRSLEQLRLTTERRLKNIFETFDLDGKAEFLDRSERRRFNPAGPENVCLNLRNHLAEVKHHLFS